MKYFEYTSVSVNTQWQCVHHIKNTQASAVQMTEPELSPACVYMSNCQHDKSDRCYFCIFKNKFVIYKVFYCFCPDQFLN